MIDIDDLIGKRYEPNGRGPETYDCYGLAIEVSRRFGHKLPDLAETRVENPDFDACKGIVEKKVKVKKVDAPEKEGDVVLIRNAKGVTFHIGIYLGNSQIVHCDKYGVHVDLLKKFEKSEVFYTWL